ncbi:adhesion G-protein coupled receptor G6-like isoform X2 [Liolophura sinensis]|uniref:adhesion G-protein coupled receptor G6-like isoform X2 n=1 Tax=Liolophura sinensis TaxID=3198878 RepID=UPI003159777C
MAITVSPTKPLTGSSTKPPTDGPTRPPTDAPTKPPTDEPTKPLTDSPTKPPTDGPTRPPTDGPTKPPTDGPTKPLTDSPTKPPTDSPTKPPTDGPTKTITDATTRPPTDGPTRPPTDGPTKPPTDGPTKPLTDSPTKPPTDSPTRPPTDGPTKTITDAPTKPPTDEPTKSLTDSPTKKITDAPTKPLTDSPTKPPTDGPTKPLTDSPTKTITDAPTKPLTDSPTKPPTDGPTKPLTDSPTRPTTDEPTKPLTDSPTKTITDAPTKSLTDSPRTDMTATSPSVANTDSLVTRTTHIPLETIASSPSKGSSGSTASVATPGVTGESDSSESDEAISCYVCRNETDEKQCKKTAQCTERKPACMSSIQLTRGRSYYTMECAVTNECSNRCTCTEGRCSVCCEGELCNSVNDVSRCVCQTNTGDRFTWPKTLQGSTAELPCSGQFTGKATRQCSSTSTWRDPDFSKCQSKITGDLDDILKENISEKTMKVSSRIMKLTERSSEFSEQDVEKAVWIVTELLQLSRDARDRNVIKNTLSAMSNMFQVPKRSLVGAERKYKSAKGYLKAIDNFTGHVDIKDSAIEEVNPNLAIVVKQISPTDFKNITLEVDRQVSGKESVIIGDSMSTVTEGVYKDSISLPATLFSNVDDSSKQDGDRASFILHEDDIFFKAIQDAQEQPKAVGDRNETSDGNETPDREDIRQVNSRVLSVSIGNLTLVNLHDPVVITFTHRLQNSSNPQCVFWDTLNGTWSDRGCLVRESVNGSHTICQCDHLTNFALLMDVYNSGTTESNHHAENLTLLSFIGCAISFFGLVLTIIIYCLFSKLRRDTPSKILLNLCLALACANVTFIIGIYALENPALCKAIAILMHYFLLSSMVWMSIEAFYMYLALVLVFRTYFRRFLLRTMLIGWGVPLVIVAITVGVNRTENYGSLANDKLCWLNRVAFYVTFLAPVGIVLIGNSIIFAMVVRQICGLSSKKLNKSETVSLSQQFRGVAGVFILLGLTWIFAIFAIGDASPAFQYLFTIFNSLQGLFIFIFFCLMKRDIQKRMFCCDSQSFPSSSSRGTHSTNHGTKHRFRAAVNAVMTTRLVSKRDSSWSVDSDTKLQGKQSSSV